MQLVTFALIFLAVLALAGLVLWLVRRFSGSRLGSSANRGRMPRLAVIDAAPVDNRRRLVLVRRDNVEHLLMIGGPSDIVIEPNIVRAAPQRDQMSPRGPVGAELPPRVAPLPDAGNWADAPLDTGDHDPVLPELPPRPVRPSFSDDVRRTSPSISERRNDPLAGMSADPIPRPDPRPEPPVRPRPLPRSSEPIAPRSESLMPRGDSAMPRGEPLMPRSEPMMPRPSAPPVEPVAKAPPPVRPAERPAATAPSTLSAADQNLAEMAQRLEAALRKPSEAAAADRAPPVAPEPPSRPAPRPAAEISVNPPSRSETIAPPVAPPGPKVSFENLEDEMASLLGRPKTPT